MHSNSGSMGYVFFTIVGDICRRFEIPGEYVLIINSILIACIIPYFNTILEFFHHYFKLLFKTSEFTIRYQDSIELPQEQRTLEAIRYYIAAHQDALKIRNLKSRQLDVADILDSTNISFNEAKEMVKPKMYDIEDHKVLIEFGASEYVIIRKYSKTKSKDVVEEGTLISGNSIASIERFVEMCKREYTSYLLENKSYYNLYRISQRGRWDLNKIKTVKTLENIYLEAGLKSKVISKIEGFIKSEQLYKKHGISYKIGFMFHGEPGLGKTSIAYAIAQEYKRNIYSIVLTDIKPGMMHQVFSQIPDHSIVLFDDVDRSMDESMMSSNKYKVKSSDGKLGALLEILDANHYLYGCMIIMTSNNYDKIDPAIIRPGRIDHAYEFTPVSSELLRIILTSFFPNDIAAIEKYMPRQNISGKKISVSKLINTIILPNLGCIDVALKEL